MKKLRFLSILCMAFAVMALFLLADPTEAQAATEVASGTCGADGDNLTWTLDNEGTLTISGTGAMMDWQYRDIVPWNSRQNEIHTVIINKGVTSIGEYAFYYCHNLSSVTIGESVATIGKYAFYYCRALTSITIPDSVTSIGDSAFYQCYNLSSVTIGTGLVTVDQYAFENCTYLTDVYIDDIAAWCKIEFAGSYANPLYYAENLYLKGQRVTQLDIPEDVTRIGDHAFHGYTAMESVRIPDSVTSIGISSFGGCTGLTSVYINDLAAWCKINFSNEFCNPLYYGHNLYSGDQLVTKLVLPDGITDVGDYTFSGCTSITEVNLPDSVLTIGKGAFQACTGLTSVSIPNHVTSIGDYAYSRCTGLTNVEFGEDLTSIGEYTFSYCTSLLSVTIPKSVTNIGESAFVECNGLTGVYINSIEAWCKINFYGESSASNPLFFAKNLYLDDQLVTKLVIPNGVTKIGQRAFINCTSITSVNINKNLSSVDSMAFYGCSGLKGVYINDIAAWCNIKFDGNYANPLYYAKKLYAGNQLVTQLDIPEGVTSISAGLFSGCTNITSVRIPESVTEIGASAFYGCSGLKGVYINDIAAWCNIKFDGNYANPLYYAKKLYAGNQLVTQLDIPEGVTSISDSLFYGCTSLTSVRFPKSTAEIGMSAFYGCTGLTTVTIGDGVKSIGESAFYGCTGLTTVMFGSGVEKIGNFTFFKTGLTTVVISDSVTSIGNSAFAQCKNLSSVTIGNAVTQIGSSAFAYCTGLTEVNYNAIKANDLTKTTGVFRESGYNDSGIKVTIGSEVVSIPAYLFTYWGYSSTDEAKISSIIFEGSSSCKYIGEDAFEYNGEPTGVYITDIASWCNIYFVNEGSNPLWYAHDLYLNGELVTDLVIPSNVTDIHKFAFSTCQNINSIIFEGTIQKIGDQAFYNCTGLTSIIIPNGATSIGNSAFYNCSALEHVTIPNSVTTIGENAFYNCSILAQVTIPDSVTVVGGYAFHNTAWYNNQPDGLVYVGKVAYKYKGVCPVTVTIKEGTSGIAGYAFTSCSNLRSIEIPDSVTYIGYRAFDYCSALETVIIGSGVETIEDYAFTDCTSLVRIYFNAVNMNDFYDDNYVFSYAGRNGSGIKIIVGKNVTRIPAYFMAAHYAPKVITVEFEENSVCEVIGACAFESCNKLEIITIPDSVTTIGGNAFWNTAWYNAQPDGLVYAGKVAYKYKGTCPATVVINEGTLGIADLAFSDAYTLAEISIPNSVTVIGDSAFSFCTNLTSVSIPGSVKTIGNGAFSSCYNLQKITIDHGVSCIGEQAFAWNHKLSSVVIPGSVENIGNSAFYDCSALEYVTIENGVSIIGQKAFSWNEKIGSVVIPDSVTRIEDEAFAYCEGLTTITVGKGVTFIGREAFRTFVDEGVVTFAGPAPTIEAGAFNETAATAYYPADDTTWTRNVRQNYGGTITWVPYGNLVTVCIGAESVSYETLEQALVNYGTGYIRLNANLQSEIALSKDLYIDLNGFDLSGTIVTNGYKVYGMDSTTDSYSCEGIGYFSCVDENGEAVVPVTQFKSDITGAVRRYMAIKTNDGYSFHRFYLGVTHMSLKPTSTGVGYKAVFYGDDMVAAALDKTNAFGFTMQLDGYDPMTAYMSADKFVSGKTITLRINNFDVENFGQTELSACVMLQLADGTVIESTAVTMTMRGLMEQLNTAADTLTAEQLAAVAAMIEKHAIIKQWNTENLY